MAIVQVYNPRSKKWVKLDDEKKGGIIAMQEEKFEDCPVKDKSKNPEHEPKKEPKKEPENKSKASRYFKGIFGL